MKLVTTGLNREFLLKENYVLQESNVYPFFSIGWKCYQSRTDPLPIWQLETILKEQSSNYRFKRRTYLVAFSVYIFRASFHVGKWAPIVREGKWGEENYHGDSQIIKKGEIWRAMLVYVLKGDCINKNKIKRSLTPLWGFPSGYVPPTEQYCLRN